MNWQEAIAKLKKLDAEGVTELVSVVEGRLSDLEADKFSVIGEKRTATQKATAYESALTAIAQALGIEGDLESILSNAEGKVRTIASELTQLKTDKTTLETRATEAEGKLQSFERKAKLTEIATAAGANAAVLEKLLGDKFDQLKIEGEGDARKVLLGDKPLKEAIAADESLKLFEAALFPAASASPSPAPTGKLPSGSPKGQTPGTADPIAAHLKNRYTGWKAAQPSQGNS